MPPRCTFKTGHVSVDDMVQPVAQAGILVGLLAVVDTDRCRSSAKWIASVQAKRPPGHDVDTGWRRELLSPVETRLKNGLTNMPTVASAMSGEAVYVARGLLVPRAVANREFVTRVLGRIQSVPCAEPEAAVLDLAAFRFLSQATVEGLRWVVRAIGSSGSSACSRPSNTAKRPVRMTDMGSCTVTLAVST